MNLGIRNSIRVPCCLHSYGLNLVFEFIIFYLVDEKCSRQSETRMKHTSTTLSRNIFSGFTALWKCRGTNLKLVTEAAVLSLFVKLQSDGIGSCVHWTCIQKRC